MDNLKVDEVFKEIATILEATGHTPDRLGPGEAMPGRQRALNHCLALCKIATGMGPERLGKKFRWLGFVQGCLWAYGFSTIDGLKRMNMPESEIEP